MNALRKISIDTVLLALAVVLCLVALALLGGAAWITVFGVGAVVTLGTSPACPTCGGEGTVESSEPFMMSAIPCPACSPLTVGIANPTGVDKGAKAEQWESLAVIAAAWIGLGPCSRDVPSDEEAAGFEAFHKRRGCVLETFREYAGLALFARLMAFVAGAEQGTAATDARDVDAATLIAQVRERLLCFREVSDEANASLCDLVERQAAEIVLFKRCLNESQEQLVKEVVTASESKAEIERLKAERDEARAELTHYVTLLRESAPDIDKALEGSKPADLKDQNAWTVYAFIATLTGLRAMEEVRTQQRDAAQLEVAALKLSVSGVRSAFADGEASERRKRDITIERLQGELDAARAEIKRMADPFPPGRGPETCGTHCARCGEKIHLVRPTTGPDREERLENHCCPGGAS